MTYVAPFTHCCGAEIIYEFSMLALYQQEKDWKRLAGQLDAIRKSRRFALAILNKKQQEAIGDKMIELGFELLTTAESAHGGYLNYLYAFNNNRPSTTPLYREPKPGWERLQAKLFGRKYYLT